MRSVRVPATIILTFPPQTKITEEVAQAAIFACEQHLNNIGMINYKGPMIQVGTLDFGLRVHMHPESMKELKAEVVEMFPEKREGPTLLKAIGDLLGGDKPDAKGVPSIGGLDYPAPSKEEK